MRFKFAAVILSLLAWAITFCVAPMPSHACCKNPEKQVTAPRTCCLGQPLAEHQPGKTLHGGDFGGWTVATGALAAPFIESAQASTNQSRLDNRLAADESDRYLKLRVLLN